MPHSCVCVLAVYSSMDFVACIDLCNHSNTQDAERFHHLQRTPSFFLFIFHLSPSLTPCNHCTAVGCYSFVFLSRHRNGNMQCTTFWGWPFLLAQYPWDPGCWVYPQFIHFFSWVITSIISTTMCLIHSSKNEEHLLFQWVIRNTCYRHICTGFCGNVRFYFLSINTSE